MTDSEIIQKLFDKNNDAFTVLTQKYQKLCHSVISHILPDERDIEECLNDTWLRVWNAIPPEKPASLKAYLARISRNLALDRYNYNSAAKRNSSLTEAFEELEDFLPDAPDSPELEVENKEFSVFINSFLGTLPERNRIIFVRRYWYGENISEIATALHLNENTVKSSLFRSRSKLQTAMEKEGIAI